MISGESVENETLDEVITLEDQGIEREPHDAKVVEGIKIPLWEERRGYRNVIGYYHLPSGIITTPQGNVSTLAKRGPKNTTVYSNNAHMKRQKASMTADFTYREDQ